MVNLDQMIHNIWNKQSRYSIQIKILLNHMTKIVYLISRPPSLLQKIEKLDRSVIVSDGLDENWNAGGHMRNGVEHKQRLSRIFYHELFAQIFQNKMIIYFIRQYFILASKILL